MVDVMALFFDINWAIGTVLRVYRSTIVFMKLVESLLASIAILVH